MAEFQDVIHTFSEYCSDIIRSDKQCCSCNFHYLKNDLHAGCMNYLVKYPEESEDFLMKWSRKTKVKKKFKDTLANLLSGFSKPKSSHSKGQVNNTYHSAGTCTMCGKQLDEFDLNENYGFEYHIGYGSKYDLQHVKARFCCACFDHLLDDLSAKCKSDLFLGEYHYDDEGDIDAESVSSLTQ